MSSSIPGTPSRVGSPSISGPSRLSINDADRMTPTRRASAISAGNTEQRRARRAELRQFYGMKGDDNKVGQDDAENLRRGTGLLDIDSPAFDAKAYYDDLVARASLAELMKTASKLGNDVADLQSSRHALVYNHHHQLFAAGDTISHLNSRTPQLLGIMTSLQQSFSEISRLAEEVTSELPDQEEQVEEWKRGVQRLKLMITAKKPKSKVQAQLEEVRHRMSDDPNEGAKAELEELERNVQAMEEDEAA